MEQELRQRLLLDDIERKQQEQEGGVVTPVLAGRELRDSSGRMSSSAVRPRSIQSAVRLTSLDPNGSR